MIPFVPVAFGATHNSSVEQLVAFVAEHLGFQRRLDGALTPLGERLQRLLDERYVAPAPGRCDEFDGTPTRQQFWQFLSHAQPVVLKNLTAAWPAHEWTNEWLLQQVGADTNVMVKASLDGDFEGVEAADRWLDPTAAPIPAAVQAALLSPNLVVARPADVSLRFGDFL